MHQYLAVPAIGRVQRAHFRPRQVDAVGRRHHQRIAPQRLAVHAIVLIGLTERRRVLLRDQAGLRVQRDVLVIGAPHPACAHLVAQRDVVDRIKPDVALHVQHIVRAGQIGHRDRGAIDRQVVLECRAVQRLHCANPDRTAVRIRVLRARIHPANRDAAKAIGQRIQIAQRQVQRGVRIRPVRRLRHLDAPAPRGRRGGQCDRPATHHRAARAQEINLVVLQRDIPRPREHLPTKDHLHRPTDDQLAAHRVDRALEVHHPRGARINY